MRWSFVSVFLFGAFFGAIARDYAMLHDCKSLGWTKVGVSDSVVICKERK